jgi:hypothetical protein
MVPRDGTNAVKQTNKKSLDPSMNRTPIVRSVAIPTILFKQGQTYNVCRVYVCGRRHETHGRQEGNAKGVDSSGSEQCTVAVSWRRGNETFSPTKKGGKCLNYLTDYWLPMKFGNVLQTKTKLRGVNPRENYTDRATATYRRS